MDKEYYINKRIYPKGEVPMRVPAQTYMSSIDFQNHLIGAKTLKGKLAVCINKLSETGCFSDSSSEVWEFREQMREHLPEALKRGKG